tara:strand:+ start:120 stop:677 length:558 start_codon:yes stop_codon:yes gene_type:complete
MHNQKSALILLAHGSKNPNWKKPFENLKQNIQMNYDSIKVELAFFELDAPLLEDTINRLVMESYYDIKIEPLILANGFHLEKDLPQRLQKLKDKHVNLRFKTGSALIENEFISSNIRNMIIKKFQKEKNKSTESLHKKNEFLNLNKLEEDFYYLEHELNAFFKIATSQNYHYKFKDRIISTLSNL